MINLYESHVFPPRFVSSSPNVFFSETRRRVLAAQHRPPALQGSKEVRLGLVFREARPWIMKITVVKRKIIYGWCSISMFVYQMVSMRNPTHLRCLPAKYYVADWLTDLLNEGTNKLLKNGLWLLHCFAMVDLQNDYIYFSYLNCFSSPYHQNGMVSHMLHHVAPTCLHGA